MKTMYVLVETDLSDSEVLVLGVFDSNAGALVAIDKYYGEYEETSFKDVRDSGIEWYKWIAAKDHADQTIPYKLTLLSFTLNSI